MKRAFLLVCILFCFARVFSQQDSSCKLRFSGFQFDLASGFYPAFKPQYQEDYQKIVNDDPYLHTSLAGYKEIRRAAFYSTFNALVGVNFFAEIVDDDKLKKEIFVGLRYGQEFNTAAYYSKTDYDTVGVLYDGNGNKAQYRIVSFESIYNYGLHSDKIVVPFGMNITTDKKKLFWITAGVEVAPIINFNYTFRSNNYTRGSDILMYTGDTIGSPNNFVSNHMNFGSSNERRTKLKGLGFGASVAVPISLYFHPFKKLKYWQHLNGMLSVIPGYLYTQTKYSGSASQLTTRLSAGLRFNW